MSIDAAQIHEQMIQRVANALGPELCTQVTFVGGCTTALLLSDEIVRTTLRFTDDVDVALHVDSHAAWYRLERQLFDKGFKQSQEDDVLCRLRLHDGGEPLTVDFMPDDPSILGFTNRWYGEAIRLSAQHTLPNGISIRLVTPPYFVATKLEAFLGRGHGDVLGSQDIEDILAMLDGRPSLAEEVSAASRDVKRYIAEQLAALMQRRHFKDQIDGYHTRSRWIHQQLRALIASGTD